MDTDRKQLATLTARAALRGVSVHAMTSAAGGTEYLACRWNLTKSFTSLDDLKCWLDRIGAPA